MSAKKKKGESRQGKLAEGRSQTSVTMDEDLLAWGRAQAKADGRSFSNWLAKLAKEEKLRRSTEEDSSPPRPAPSIK